MSTTVTPHVLPDIEREDQTDSSTDLDPGYLVVCWDDPVNLMEYVTHVFQMVFGWTRKKAEKHMLEVHNHGKSLLLRAGLEKAEFHVHQLQKYNLPTCTRPWNAIQNETAPDRRGPLSV